ncbi:hypothetical protein RRG08_010864 [Elysia crispata]|uniref:Uncharacterized protein n=1 Tax=Elysia crispata TaxID=231223 RepID=A0AAE0XT29_9GAST|nr:hypothetical protein RRG08_010864 [Elysia crispata]
MANKQTNSQPASKPAGCMCCIGHFQVTSCPYTRTTTLLPPGGAVDWQFCVCPQTTACNHLVCLKISTESKRKISLLHTQQTVDSILTDRIASPESSES